VGLRRWSAVIAGFIGVLIMTRPRRPVQSRRLVRSGGAVFYALAMISVRWLSATNRRRRRPYFTLFATAAGASPCRSSGRRRQRAASPAGIGLIGGVAQMAMTQAFRMAPASIVAPFEYLARIRRRYRLHGLAQPDAFILTGSAVVIASGLYILHRETVRGRHRGH
jgi:drug/metabolite transporter (DMT)-like permease